MGEDQKYYDVEDYKRWKAGRGKKNPVAPRPNLLAAVSWLRRFFEARKTNWAAMGSLAMLCLGARREIPDIHIVYDDKEFERIRKKLQSDPRVRLPNDMTAMFAFKLLVSTGPKYRDFGCTENFDIEVDVIPPGSHATPPSDILQNNLAKLSLNLDGKITSIRGLNLIYLVNTTVHLCNDAGLAWDAKKDLLWLCQKYGKELQSVRRQLNARKVQENFLGTPYFFTLSAEEQRLCYHVLLGKEPPPGLFLIPAPKGTSATGNASIPAHKSAPSLKDSMQQQQQQQGSGLLRPPMPHKAKTAPSASMSGSASQNHPTPPPKDDASASARDSRSRYRNSSAPTTPSASRTVSPEARPARTSMESRSDRTQKHHRIYQAQSINIQNVAAKLQVVQTKGSPTRTAVPPFAHKTSTAPAAAKQDTNAGPAIASIDSETKPQSYGLGSQVHSNDSIQPSASNTAPQAATYTHPARKIIAHRNSMLPVDHNKPAVETASPSAGHITSDTSSKGLSIVGPEGLYPTRPKPTTHAAKSPATVPTIQKPTQPVSSGFVFELDAVSPQVATFPATISARDVAELPTPKDVAELPANNEATPQSPRHMIHRTTTFSETPISPPQVQAEFAQSSSMAGYRDSPVSPPTTYKQLDLVVQPLKPKPSARASTMVATPPSSAPKLSPSPPTFDALPPSLMIGFRSPQRQLTSDHPSRARASSETSNGSSTSNTPKQYERYYSPPLSRQTSPNNASLSTPTSKQPSPNLGPVYKAYTPPITPPIHPKSEAQTPPVHPHPSTHPHTVPPPAPVPAVTPSPPQPSPLPMDRASNFPVRTSPPPILRAGAPQPLKPTRQTPLPNPLAANPPTPRLPSHAKHDSHQGQQILDPPYSPYAYAYAAPPQQQQSQPQYIAFSMHHVPSTQPVGHPSGHQRSVSAESCSSTASHESERLAMEYQVHLPAFEAGFGEQAERELRGAGRG